MAVDNKLVARHSLNPDISLYFLSESAMYSYRSIFGRLHFKFDKHQSVSGFMLSGANFSQIELKKIK